MTSLLTAEIQQIPRIKGTSSIKPEDKCNSLRIYSANGKTADEMMSEWGILDGYIGWTLSDFGIDVGLGGHVDWSSGGFFLHGVTGSGKSCLASALVRDRMDRDHPQTVMKGKTVKRLHTVDDEDVFGEVILLELPEKAVAWHYALEVPHEIPLES